MNVNTMTDAELVVLSLICEQPMHGYQVEQQISQRNMRAWTGLATSSIYYVLQRLHEKGFIAEADREGGSEGLPRKTYRITDSGRHAWKEATLNALSKPNITYSNFLLGLHNLWNISPEEALEAVERYRDWLEADLQRQRDALEALGEPFFPLDVLFDYGFVLGEAELSFLDGLIDRLQVQKEASTGEA